MTSFLSVSLFYRFSNQTAVRYFAPYGQHSLTDKYYTSGYDISGFTNQFIGTGIRVAPPVICSERTTGKALKSGMGITSAARE